MRSIIQTRKQTTYFHLSKKKKLNRRLYKLKKNGMETLQKPKLYSNESYHENQVKNNKK